MQRLLSFFLIIFSLAVAADSVHGQFTMGSKNVALGQAVTALPQDQWAPFHNPAQLSEQMHTSFFAIRYFDLAELTDMAFSGSYNLSRGLFGVGMTSYGDERFRESQFRLAFAEEVFNVRIGSTISMFHMTIDGHGSAVAPTLDFGIAADLTDGLVFGARTSNITRSTIGADESELPADLAVGLSYRLMERATLVTELYKDVDFDPSFRAGLEVELVDILLLRGGLTHDHPQTYTFGVGIEQSRWNAGVVVEQHQQLGLSPGIDFSVLW